MNDKDKLGEFFSPQEVAERLGVHRRTVLNLLYLGRDTKGKAGIYPWFKTGYRTIRIPATSVNAYLEALV